MLIKNS